MSKVKDLSLSERGKAELAWARINMPVLAEIRKRFEKEKPFSGMTIGVALHMEKKTGILLETLSCGGAKVLAGIAVFLLAPRVTDIGQVLGLDH